jgi:hypothetical protein
MYCNRYTVKSNGGALRYASPGLRDDKENVQNAVIKDASAMQYASQRLRSDKEFIYSLIDQGIELFG